MNETFSIRPATECYWAFQSPWLRAPMYPIEKRDENHILYTRSVGHRQPMLKWKYFKCKRGQAMIATSKLEKGSAKRAHHPYQTNLFDTRPTAIQNPMAIYPSIQYYIPSIVQSPKCPLRMYCVLYVVVSHEVLFSPFFTSNDETCFVVCYAEPMATAAAAPQQHR